MFLLDVNILIAVADADHEHHARATTFFEENREAGWATCPISENGFLRIIGNPNYPGEPGSTNLAKGLLADLCKHPDHQFWPDEVSLQEFDDLPGSKKLTDHYLLALAIRKNGKLATMDARINPLPSGSGQGSYFVIP
ncbi:hypothetical protein HNR46_004097 [Haloferula luteola]|uniref:Ribonuclease VapC n=1 Tax=Haloferula luteola TaxID=595692 RepID=A0A840V7Y4_9BACT|nr:TA system VapC family ribonuclease toxin [Haloferula luteola]MBB5353833.1 hypothetical protein [Haloferula luteola]